MSELARSVIAIQFCFSRDRVAFCAESDSSAFSLLIGERDLFRRTKGPSKCALFRRAESILYSDMPGSLPNEVGGQFMFPLRRLRLSKRELFGGVGRDSTLEATKRSFSRGIVFGDSVFSTKLALRVGGFGGRARQSVFCPRRFLLAILRWLWSSECLLGLLSHRESSGMEGLQS